MKRATREWAKSQIELQREMRTHGDRYFVDILDSDKKQRETIKDLKARLREVRGLIDLGELAEAKSVILRKDWRRHLWRNRVKPRTPKGKS